MNRSTPSTYREPQSGWRLLSAEHAASSRPEHRLPTVGGGRINEEDIAAVRDRARIEEIVGSYVTLRSAGGTDEGPCPFHDEKTPSFQVTPSRGYWYCLVPAPRVATSSTSCARSTTSRLWRQSSGSPIAWAFSCATPTMEAPGRSRVRASAWRRRSGWRRSSSSS